MAFQDNLRLGQMTENLILRYLQYERGCSFLPVYESEADFKGPRLIVPNGELIAPDALCFSKKLRVFFVEAKRKTCFTWHRLTGEWCTGVDLSHYIDYLAIRKEWDLPMWLMFLHVDAEPRVEDRRYECPPVCPTGLYANEILFLDSHKHHEHPRGGRHGMVYWGLDALIRVATVDEVLRAAARKGPATESGGSLLDTGTF